MADLISPLLSFPPEKQVSAQEYDKQANIYLKLLQSVPPATWAKPIDKSSVLELLDPAVNSIPYLYCLLEHTKAAGNDKKEIESILEQVVVFFATFDPIQVRYAGNTWRELFTWTTEAFRLLGVTDVSALSTAILRLDPSAGTFTTNHLLFLRICLEAGIPSQALSILDQDIYAYPQSAQKGIPEDLLSEEHELSNAFISVKSGFSLKVQAEFVLEYYLLGAYVYIGQRCWNRARLFLECVLLHPSTHHAISALQIEAYKKWVLVGLLSIGKLYPHPKTVDQQVMKNVKAIAKPYEALAETFERRDWRRFRAELDVGAQTWADDGNHRLVHEAGAALFKYRVVDLQKTYAALPVKRVASHFGLPPDQTLDMLTQMTQQRQLDAEIVAGQGRDADDVILKFSITGSSASVGGDDFEARTQRVERLVRYVRDADRRLQVSKELVDVARRAKRPGVENDLADQMDLDWNPPPPAITSVDDEGDEDIMA